MLNKYGQPVYDVIQQYCKNQNIKTAFQNVIIKYQEQDNTDNSYVCFNPLIKSDIAYVDKESLGATNKNATKTFSIKSLA